MINNQHLTAITPSLTRNRVVPFMGAGVNVVERVTEPWEPGTMRFLPTGYELSRFLVEKYEYPPEEPCELARVTQYISVIAGRRTLYDELHQIFNNDYTPTSVHRFFASLPKVLQDQGHKSNHQLIITLNYDDLMERAFREANEPFDVVSYVADGPNRGKFLHRLYSGELRLIERIKEYQDIDLDKRSLVLKMHGSVDRFDQERDSYVITEDDYIEYLIRADIANLLPPELVSRLQRSQFLFLGYGLRDWNLRVILTRIWGEQRLRSKSWAVQMRPSDIDKLLWNERNVEILDAPLGEYMKALSERI